MTKKALIGGVALALLALGMLPAGTAEAQPPCDRYDDGSLRPANDPNPDPECGGKGFEAPQGGIEGVGSLTTLFVSDNQFAGNTFDVEVFTPLTITSFDVNLALNGTNNTMEIYWRNGTANGNESSPAGWMSLGQDPAVTGAGLDVPAAVALGGLALVPAQVFGMYVDLFSYPSDSLRYTNGGPNVYSNADMQITTLHGKGNPAFTGTSFFPRQWNGTIYYDLGGGDSDLVVVKDGVDNGDGTGTYTITVTNGGPDDDSAVVVTDPLPAGVTYVSDDCLGMNVPPWTWNVGMLANGASATCNILVNIVDPNDTDNTATATGANTDPNPGNNSGSSSLVALGIPTLGTWGLALLAGLILAAGAMLLRRRVG